MKLLITVPHDTLLSPQGHRERLDGLLLLLNQNGDEVHILLPESTPLSDRNFREGTIIHEFREPRVIRQRIPFGLDWSQSFLRAVRHCCFSNGIELIISDFPWGAAGAARAANVPVAIFSHGVESDFAPIVLKSFGLNFPPVSTAFRSFIAFIERRACSAAKLVMTISPEDRQNLHSRFGTDADKIWYLPQPIEPRRPVISKQQARQDLAIPPETFVAVFHGSRAHLPNREAVELIKSDILPRIDRNAVLILVAGPGMPEEAQPGYRSVGYQASLDCIFAAADLAIVPIISGAGVRMKILDYFRAGVPVLTTKKGIEGIAVSFGEEAIVTDNSPESIAEGIESIRQEPDRLRAVSANAEAYLRAHHRRENIGRELAGRLAQAAGSGIRPTNLVRAARG